MNRRALNWVLVLLAATPLLLTALVWWWPTDHAIPTDFVEARRLPRIRPDYTGVVIPPNIAPLNFLVEEPGTEFRVRIHAARGNDIRLASRKPSIVIPLQPWRDLLGQNRGGSIEVDVYVKSKDGRWSRYGVIENTIAREDIDSHLVYRLLGPVCNYFSDVRICQRNLENFDERTVVGDDLIDGGCVNCHSFQNNRPDVFSFHVRPGLNKQRTAAGMILVRDGRATRLNTKSKAAPQAPGYLSWQRSGWVAFSLNRPDQVFRGAGAEIRDVFDYRSDIAVMNAATCEASTSPGVADPERQETFPSWSADGKVLYFCSAKTPWGRGGSPTADDLKNTKYDLMRAPYDVDVGVWGKPETVLAASETGKSILEPRASPDGRYLLFCLTDYGGFPVHQPGCDLYLMDLKDGKYRRLDCNSDQADSWHCWSSNSRWIVFSSKRDNGLLARPYFSYLDAEGREHKPFLLPQKDPEFYDTSLKTYNVPELVTGPVTVSQADLVRAILSSKAGGDKTPQSAPTDGPGSDHYMRE